MFEKAHLRFVLPFYNQQDKLGDQGRPDLYLDGIPGISEEIFKQKVLFEPFEQQVIYSVFYT